MSNKITEKEFEALKELCEIKGFEFSIFDYATSKRPVYISEPNLVSDYYTAVYFTRRESQSISFNEAIKILEGVNPRTKITLTNDLVAEIVKGKVVLLDYLFTHDDIEKLYKATKDRQ